VAETQSTTDAGDADPKFCALSTTLGNEEECPGAWCAFWERGGAVVPGRCGLERLVYDTEDRALAGHLLDLRHTLEQARSEEEARAARAEFKKLVPPDLHDAD
jgi:hypothetical protein